MTAHCSVCLEDDVPVRTLGCKERHSFCNACVARHFELLLSSLKPLTWYVDEEVKFASQGHVLLGVACSATRKCSIMMHALFSTSCFLNAVLVLTMPCSSARSNPPANTAPALPLTAPSRASSHLSARFARAYFVVYATTPFVACVSNHGIADSARSKGLMASKTAPSAGLPFQKCRMARAMLFTAAIASTLNAFGCCSCLVCH